MMHFSHRKMVSSDEREAGLGGAESPIKENGVGFIVPDEEEERVVCVHFYGGESTSKSHLTPGAGWGLCTLFVYFYKGLVENIGQK